MKMLFALFLACSVTATFAQDSVRIKRVRYFFSVSSATLAGKRNEGGVEMATSLSTVHGVVIARRLRAGVGIGIDNYANWQTLPLFGHVQYDVISGKRGVFAQLNGGWAKAWMPRESNVLLLKESGGLLINPMVGGYATAGHLRLSISLGYKFQQTKTESGYRPTDLAIPYYAYSVSTERTFERLVFAIGVGWR